MKDYQYAVGALIELKDNALLLSLGNEYLKDETFLIKIGNSIMRTVEVLRRDITSLKKEYPGKFMNEVDTDAILKKIDSIAQRMIKPAKETRDDHISGQLGREMTSLVASVTMAVNDMRMRIQGTHADQSSGSAGNTLNTVKGIFVSTGSLIAIGAKIFACLLVLFAAVFFYFYFTMEKDTKFINEITSTEAVLKEKKGLLPKLQREKQGLEANRAATDQEMTREQKVAALELEVKIKKIDSAIDQANAEILVYEEKLKENQGKLEAMRKKPFLKRLLKQ